jgi:hypothetical protein
MGKSSYGWLLFEQNHKIDNNNYYNNYLMSLLWDHLFESIYKKLFI